MFSLVEAELGNGQIRLELPHVFCLVSRLWRLGDSQYHDHCQVVLSTYLISMLLRETHLGKQCLRAYPCIL